MTAQLRLLCISVLLCVACKNEPKLDTGIASTPAIHQIELSKGAQVIQEAIEAHGGDLYTTAAYTFTFRNNQYTFINREDGYRYEVHYATKYNGATDVLENGDFTRTVHGENISLSEKDISSYSQALNSVIYFATLPHKLKDASVCKTYTGETEIDGSSYDVVQIHFTEEGGGQDFDDIYSYWINTDTKRIDYLAYTYSVNGGGVRFRKAYNTREVDGILFQDYINYEAAVGTPLSKLPTLYENRKLKELSRIETENVKPLNLEQ